MGSEARATSSSVRILHKSERFKFGRSSPPGTTQALYFLVMLSTLLAVVFLVSFSCLSHVSGRRPSTLRESLLPDKFLVGNATHSLNVSTCPGSSKALDLETKHTGAYYENKGYTLSGLQSTETGLRAYLNLAGPECNAFGQDVANLTLEVNYDTNTR